MKIGKTSRRRFLLAALLLTPGAVMADACWVEPNWVKVRTLRLCDRTPTRRLVHITDLHHKGDRAYLELVVAKINSLSPDFVCFTGDLVEESKHVPEALEVLKKLKSPLYGIPGNHDYWAEANFGTIGKAFKSTGGAWLMDSQITTADGKVQLTGASCAKWRQPMGVKFHPPTPGCFNIMLIHYPAFIHSLAPYRFDLVLAGHSHGGQVRVPFYGALIHMSGTDRYDQGLFQTEAGPLYVNPGLGWFYSPIRFNCRPEITVFEV